MRRLLSIELFKLRFSKSAKVLSIIYFLLFFSTAIFSMIRFKFGDFEFQLAEQGIFNFPYIWHFNTYMVALIKLFLAVVIVSMVSSEYTNRTLKQNFIDGLSKKEFVLSKFYTILLFALVSTVLVFVVSLVLGLIYSDYNELSIVFSDLHYLLAYFIKLTAFFSLCMFLAILIRKSAFALGFLFLLLILESIAMVSLRNEMPWLSQFFPLESMANLIKEPFTRFNVVKSASTAMGTDFTRDVKTYWYEFLIPVVWTFIFVYSSLKVLKNRDL